MNGSHPLNNEMIGKIAEDCNADSNSIEDTSFGDIKSPAPLLTKKPTLFLRISDHSVDSNGVTVTTKEPIESVHPSNDLAKISPRGSLHIGQWRIHENGLMTNDIDKKTIEQSKKDHDGILEGGSNQFIEIGPLGSGASGVVMEALHIPTLTIVALKMLPVYNTQKRQQVSRELQILYKNLISLQLINESLHIENITLKNYETNNNLQSKNTCLNVLSLYNAFIDPKSGMINLVIEYMDGGSLQDLVNRGGCQDEDILADIAIQTLYGLKFLHDNNNIHRDIKPANILTSTKGIVKIADFGISKALDSNGVASSFVGTVCYMSPERITGGTYSYSCDIWSFGLTMLAVAEGKFPLESGENHSVKGGYWGMIKAICDDNPPQPDKKFSKDFIKFIGKCLQKNVDNRATASELLNFSFISNWQKKFQISDDINNHTAVALNPIIEDDIYQTNTSQQSQSPIHSSPRPKRLSSISLTGSERLNNISTSSHKKTSSNKIVYPTPIRNPINDAEADTIRVRHLEKVLDRLQSYIEDEYLSMIHNHVDIPMDIEYNQTYNTSYLSSSGKIVSSKPAILTFNHMHNRLDNQSDTQIDSQSTSHLDSPIDNKTESKQSTKPHINNKNINMIPKLEGDDMKYWMNLADQLHLPVTVVKVAAKNAFGKYI
eukprot:CAMPEP_0196764700 /NCGR_PEP_ID=MMETSP1095-20130614/6680_1 /TAXON_ID=96789 ORGANISM="Chromulina nebulosa, Strain UTEXLB2642" /NCGR_SAMPLE_ID=MMETSP1095 /ASSEMBLY_ACC=CAM_ASM_000446 /LENGTH=659 /DNA_ID=CAMNT_0042120933 /DNA_START=170 /DNA_END=2149 /DNA_ORIENTATION=-